MIDEKKLLEELFCLGRDVEKHLKNANKNGEELLEFSYKNQLAMIKNIIKRIKRQPKIVEWIPCSERMPEEHESFFAKFKGTDKWRNTMFEKSSSEVNATIEFEDGKRAVKTLHTIDGRWNEGNRGLKFKVVAWQTLPDPYKTEE